MDGWMEGKQQRNKLPRITKDIQQILKSFIDFDYTALRERRERQGMMMQGSKDKGDNHNVSASKLNPSRYNLGAVAINYYRLEQSCRRRMSM